MSSKCFDLRVRPAAAALAVSLSFFVCQPAAATEKPRPIHSPELDVFMVDVAYAAGWSRMHARRPAGAAAAPRWTSFVEQIRQSPEYTRLAAVNRYVNLAAYHSDRSLWGIDDYWATPEEFLSLGGDCEDYAITKFFVLRDAGIAASRMRIMVLRPTWKEPSHAILTVETAAGPLVLDNLKAEPYPLTSRLTSRLAFAVNETGMWVPRNVRHM